MSRVYPIPKYSQARSPAIAGVRQNTPRPAGPSRPVRNFMEHKNEYQHTALYNLADGLTRLNLRISGVPSPAYSGVLKSGLSASVNPGSRSSLTACPQSCGLRSDRPGAGVVSFFEGDERRRGIASRADADTEPFQGRNQGAFDDLSGGRVEVRGECLETPRDFGRERHMERRRFGSAPGRAFGPHVVWSFGVRWVRTVVASDTSRIGRCGGRRNCKGGSR